MVVAIQQPHYFPWLGYLEKMARADKFILMDTVQFVKGSYMYRNRIVDSTGKIKYLTISADKHGFLDKEYREIKTKDFEVWTGRQIKTLESAYGDCKHFAEVFGAVSSIFSEQHQRLCDVAIHSINLLRELFGINTPLVLQSAIDITGTPQKSELVLALCKAIGADIYYSGNGAKKYMDVEAFEKAGVHVIYQQFMHPVYRQSGNHSFEQGLSALDLLFNCGIKSAKDIFWDSIYKEKQCEYLDRT